MPKSKLVTIDIKADPQMSEAFKKLTPALKAASDQLKKMGNLSLGLKAGTESFTQSLKQVQTAMAQLNGNGPLTLKEIEESEFMVALKHVSTSAQTVNHKHHVQKLAALVYLAGGSIVIPREQIEDTWAPPGMAQGSVEHLLETQAVKKLDSGHWEAFADFPFELEVMPNIQNNTVEVFSTKKDVPMGGMAWGFDFANGPDLTGLSIVMPEHDFMELTEIGGKTVKMYMGASKGAPMLSSGSVGMGEIDYALKKILVDGFSKKGKKVSGYDNIQWLFVGGPAHGELRWIKGNVKVTSMAVTEPLVPVGLDIPAGKHPLMMHKQIQYQGHDLVVDGYRYRIGAQTQEDFNTVPMDEFGKYIEEVGLTPYAQY